MQSDNATSTLSGGFDILDQLDSSNRKNAQKHITVGNLSLRVIGKVSNISSPVSSEHIKYYHMNLVPTPPVKTTHHLPGKKGLIISLDSEKPSAISDWSLCQVEGSSLDGMAGQLSNLEQTPEVVLLMINGQLYNESSLSTGEVTQGHALLNSLYIACKTFYDSLQNRKLKVACVVYNAWDNQSALSPMTGLFGGFIKSLRRDLLDAEIVSVNTSEGISGVVTAAEKGLSSLSIEPFLPEVFLKSGEQYKLELGERTESKEEANPLLSEGMVVLATGGARGVTAVLLEELVKITRCKIIALGRTRLGNTPQHLLDMTEDELQTHESEFYRDGLAKDRTKKIVELKNEFKRHLAENEIYQFRKRVEGFGGSLMYLNADLLDSEDVERVVSTVYDRFQRLDLVIHGAGIQISKSMKNKTLDEFNSVFSTKVNGLVNLYKSVTSRTQGKETAFHLLTSAFSFWGNDGQPDYGAANEFMNRLCDYMTAKGQNWTSIAWPGWAGIGMTRGSEYAALAELRNLHPITKDEGQAVFHRLIKAKAKPQYASNIIATHKEINAYRVPVSALQSVDKSDTVSIEEVIDLENATQLYLSEHLVSQIPTMPGAAELVYCVNAAYASPEVTTLVKVTDAKFNNFLKSYPERKNTARILIQKSEENHGGLAARIESDFYHPSGQLLRSDINNMSVSLCRVSAIPEPSLIIDNIARQEAEFLILDPYTHGLGNVQLSGIFNCLKSITIKEDGQTSEFCPPEDLFTRPSPELLIPAVLIDALWRMAVLRPIDNHLPIYVPLRSDAVYLDLTGDLKERVKGARFVATRPVPSSEVPGALIVEEAVAFDAQGKVLVRNENILGIAKLS